MVSGTQRAVGNTGCAKGEARQTNNQNFFNLNKKIKLSAVFQNNKDLKQQKWGQNSPRKIVSVLHL